MDRLNSQTGRLNDSCINDVVMLMRRKFDDPAQDLYSPAAKECAVFSTYDLTKLQSDDDDIWRLTKRIKFWTKDMWIFPIHDPFQEHWTAAIVIRSSATTYVFDSFAQERVCRRDLEASATLQLERALH